MYFVLLGVECPETPPSVPQDWLERPGVNWVDILTPLLSVRIPPSHLRYSINYSCDSSFVLPWEYTRDFRLLNREPDVCPCSQDTETEVTSPIKIYTSTAPEVAFHHVLGPGQVTE